MTTFELLFYRKFYDIAKSLTGQICLTNFQQIPSLSSGNSQISSVDKEKSALF